MKEESMATKSRASKSHKQRLRGLYGGLSPSQAVARRARAAKQKELSASFAREEALRLRHARIMDRVHAPMLEALGRDAKVVRAVASLKSVARQMRRRPLARPVVPVHKTRIVADLGATVVPPYDFQETLVSSTGAPFNGSSADKTTGQITSFIDADSRNSSSETLTAAVGIFFHPPTDCSGTLSISASLTFTYEWATYCAFASAHSDGWVGIAVERFDMAGFPAGVLVGSTELSLGRQFVVDRCWIQQRIEQCVPAFCPVHRGQPTRLPCLGAMRRFDFRSRLAWRVRERCLVADLWQRPIDHLGTHVIQSGQ
jgi:hypothetical protein